MKHLFAGLTSLAMAACATPAVSAAPTLRDTRDPGVYMVVLGKVFDRQAFMEGYAAKLPPLYAKYGGEYVALTRGMEILEGVPGFESVVIAKWPNVEAARAFWTSPEYVELIRARTENGWGEFTVVLVPALAVPTQTAPALDVEADRRAPK